MGTATTPTASTAAIEHPLRNPQYRLWLDWQHDIVSRRPVLHGGVTLADLAADGIGRGYGRCHDGRFYSARSSNAHGRGPQ